MKRKTISVETVAEAYLTLLAERGIEYLFANGGTDFAPIVEAVAALDAKGTRKLKVVSVGHENVAVSMAHGYFLMTGRPAAVMFHVNVGTANGINGARQRRARQHPAAVHRRAQSDHRVRQAGLARHRHPVGPGDVRPGRHGARAGQMGLRAAPWRPAGRRGRPRARDRDHGAGRPGLSVAAARGAERADGDVQLSRDIAPRQLRRAGRRPGARSSAPPTSWPRPSGRSCCRRWPAAPRPAPPPSPTSPSASPFRRSNTARSPNSLPTQHPMNLGFEPVPYLHEADADPERRRHRAVDSGAPRQSARRLQIRQLSAPTRPISASRSAAIRATRPWPARSRSPCPNWPQALDAKMSNDRSAARSRVASRSLPIQAKTRAEVAARIESVKGATPIHPVWATHCIAAAKGDDTIVINEYPMISRFAPFAEAAHLFRHALGRRARLGCRRRDRRQDRGARPPGDRDARRRRLYVRQPDRGAHGAARARSAHPVHHLQQQPLGRGRARGALGLPRRPRRQGQPRAGRRSRAPRRITST